VRRDVLVPATLEGIPSRGQDLEARLRELAVEIRNLTDAVAKGAPFASI
jgi:hypothetical protein